MPYPYEPRWITIQGAREHNLRNIQVDIPKEAFTVITGLSGSGKSSLALDVLYAEGQRRYMESLSSYVRQFIGMPKKPDVDRIDGLAPAIAIDQKTVTTHPRSTVGTVTEIYDYLRILFARVGTLHCPESGEPIQTSTPADIVTNIAEQWPDTWVFIAAPLARYARHDQASCIASWHKHGYTRFLIDGKRYRIKRHTDLEHLPLNNTQGNHIDLLIDAVEVVPQERSRLLEAVEHACRIAQGTCCVYTQTDTMCFSTQRKSMVTGRVLPELEPRMFSFNSPTGACQICHGIGDTGYNPQQRTYVTCYACKGYRLHDVARSVTVAGVTLPQLTQYPIDKLLCFFQNIHLEGEKKSIADPVVKEITKRLAFLMNVGLSYVTLHRDARTLSGGESQRIRLARQLGSGLSGVVYVLDEPSIGLHQRDHQRLIDTLKELRDLGNTVVVVEHDDETIEQADYVIDMGPGAGIHGGAIVAAGTPLVIKRQQDSLTGAYLSGRKYIARSRPIRQPAGHIRLSCVSVHNLSNVTVDMPRGVLCGISGVSGSGKSSLVMNAFVPALERDIERKDEHKQIAGSEHIANLVVINQTPIGRTPRSNPATYIGIFDDIRTLFARLPESQARGYQPGRFSFNVSGGRCEHCSGDGVITVTLHFLPEVILTCDQCQGRRYHAETLEITYRDKTIADVLDMNVEQACSFFYYHNRIYRRLKLLWDVGLGYLKLGQSATTLSGGEAQRIKLVNELAKRGSQTVYVLDEPTTGLHVDDVKRLIAVLQRLVDKGNTVYVIEHHLDVLKVADYLIDLGPEGGIHGGQVVATGTPAHVMQNAKSYTGYALSRHTRKE